jgi:hypothetical protein
MDSTDMGLGTLGDYGGFTGSFYPSPRISRLVDAADATFCALFGELDQRRYARPAGDGGCDIGAVEADAVEDAIFADGFDG